jgi:7-cyano-7-deazaguanine synthase
MKLTKAETWALAKTLGGEDLVELIVEESHTCYQGERGDHACTLGPRLRECPACDVCALSSRKGYEETGTRRRAAGAFVPR